MITVVVMVISCVPSTLPLVASLLPPMLLTGCGASGYQEVFLYTCTRKSRFFAWGVYDENFVHLEIDFDWKYSDDLIPFFLHEVSILAYRSRADLFVSRYSFRWQWKEEGKKR